MRLIDKDALIEALMMYTWRDEDDFEIDDAEAKREYIKDWLPDLPTVEPKRGRWIERQVGNVSDCAINDIQTAKCSVCGLYYTTPYIYSFTEYEFCPHCGAAMLEGGETDD